MAHSRRMTLALVTAVLLGAALPIAAAAADKVTVTIGQRGNWDTGVSHLGAKAGIFARHGLELNLLYTSGSGETLQPVIAGAAEIGIAVGTLGAMAAYAKGAPVRIIGAQATGAADYWYAKSTSPIKTLSDTNGRTIAFSTQGSSTQSVVRAFIDEFKITARPVSTGNAAATLTAVMTGQVDVGWASPPFGLREIDAGQIRVVARATDSALVRGQTIRVLVANAGILGKRGELFARFLDAYRETIDYMYVNDPSNYMYGGVSQAVEDYAEFAGVPQSLAMRVREDFFPKKLLDPDEIFGLDSLVNEAVKLKFIDKPLTPQQLTELIQIPPRRR